MDSSNYVHKDTNTEPEGGPKAESSLFFIFRQNALRMPFGTEWPQLLQVNILLAAKGCIKQLVPAETVID
ncbi:hypothetical protein ACFLRX_05620 [Acidobacteriota bacterium]